MQFDIPMEIKLLGASVITWVCNMMGGWDIALQLLIYAMALDMVTGIWLAFKNKTLSSTKAFDGVTKKFFAFVIIMFAFLLDQALGTTMIHEAAAWFYFVGEGISILENAALAKLNVPGVLTDALEKVRIELGKDRPKE